MTGCLSLRGLLGVWGMTCSRFCEASKSTCSGWNGSLLFRILDMFVTSFKFTFEGDVGADHGLFANFALVILGMDKDLLNLFVLDVLSCGLSNTSSSDLSELVRDSVSEDELDVRFSPGNG